MKGEGRKGGGRGLENSKLLQQRCPCWPRPQWLAEEKECKLEAAEPSTPLWPALKPAAFACDSVLWEESCLLVAIRGSTLSWTFSHWILLYRLTSAWSTHSKPNQISNEAVFFPLTSCDFRICAVFKSSLLSKRLPQETFTITSSCFWYLSYEKESVSSLVIARFFGCVIPYLQQSLSDDVFPSFD